MIVYRRWLLYVTFIFACFMQQGMALELVISDSGRNHSFSLKHKLGDSFSVKGADGKPVGGTLAGTHFIEQCLVPMPSKIELEQMSTHQEDIWVKDLGSLLKHRVHIATTNGAEVFEIRLLQDTPLPVNSAMSWQEPARVDRFANMSYKAIGDLVQDIQKQEIPLHITVSLADSGGGAFARSVKSWQTYSDTFRRVDFVDARAMLTDVRKVINTLSPRRVRIINTDSSTTAPPLTIARSEVVSHLLKSRPGLTQYSLTPETKEIDKQNATPWMDSLAGYKSYRVERLQNIDNKIVNRRLNRVVTGQDFRGPKRGWEPVKQDLHSTKSLKQLGIMATSSHQAVVSTLRSSNSTGFSMAKQQISKNIGNKHFSNSPFDYISREEAHSFADIVYDTDYGKSRLPAGWKLYKGQEDKLSGLKSAIFERESDGQRVLSFAGTRNLTDWKNNIISSSSIYMYDKIMPAIFNRSIHLQNDRALQVTQSALHENKYSKSNRPLVLAGDSKAGLHVQYAGGMTRTYGVTTNSAPMGNTLLSRIPDSNKNWANTGGIRHLELKSDPVSKLDILPGSSRLGIKESYDTPKVFRETYKKTVFNIKPELFPDFLTASHTQRDLLGQAIRDRATPSRISTINISDPTTIGGTTKSEMKLVGSMLARESNVSFPGRMSPTTEKLAHNLQETHGATVRISSIPLRNKPLQGTVVKTSGSQAIGFSHNLTRNMTPKRVHEFSGYDRWKLKAPDYHILPGGGGPGGGGGGSVNDLTSRQFNRRRFNAQDLGIGNKYLPLSINDFGKNFGRPNVKGVMLSGAASLAKGAEAFGEGEVSLVFQDSNGEIDIGKLRCFVTSLWAAYLSVEGPGISIDPAEPLMDYQNVRHIGQVRNTYLACVMRETDYLMKQWAIGTHRPDIEGFLTSDDFSEIMKKEEGKGRVTGRPSRFWLVPEGLAFTRSGNMLLLSGGQMTVQTEYLDNNPEKEKNEANEAFARWFTENYHKSISAHYPIFQELFDYAQLVSLGTYLRENRVPMLKFLLSNRELIITEKSIDEVDKLKKDSDHEWYISISGGVEFDVTDSVGDEKRYTVDKALRGDYEYVKNKHTGSDNIANSVVFNSKGTDYTVTSNQSLMLSDSPATGDIVQTDFANWKEYEEVAGKEKWHLVTPAMELIRYYNPNINTRAQLGEGWHLLVPFRLEDNIDGMPLVGRTLPSQIAVVNILSGEREIMKKTIDKKTDRMTYVTLDKNAFAWKLDLNRDGSWELEDRLGATFRFDSEGDLLRLALRPEKIISFKVGDKTYRRRVPGYVIDYKYDIININGKDRKMLASVTQGNEIARVIRSADNYKTQIASIRIQHVDQGKSIEVLNYEYNEDGRLVKVIKESGHSTQIKYQDSDMRVVAVHQ